MPDVTTHQDGAVLCIGLNRPHRKNALTNAMYGALNEGLTLARQSPDIRTVLIQSTGDCFCAGNDLADFAAKPAVDPESNVVQFLNALIDFPKPLLASVQGPAVGIGSTLLLHCDLVYASPEATFSFPFIHLALVPEAGSTWLLPRLMGHAKAAEFLLLGQACDAPTAKDVGLINAVVPRPELADTALRQATALAARAPQAMQHTKALLKRATRQPLREAMSAELDLFAQQLQSEECQEAIRAFFEKRPPNFGP